MLSIEYNSQRDNYSWAGKFKGSWQCFSTCAFMLISFYTGQVEGGDDDKLKLYVDDVENSVGGKGIAEKVVKRFKWLKGRSSYWWLVQKAGIEKWLNSRGVEGKAIFRDKDLKFDELVDILETRPIIISTYKMGGLKGGHIILLAGYDSEIGGFYCLDPYGNALRNYTDTDGDYIFYNYKFLKKYTGNKVRCMYWEY